MPVSRFRNPSPGIWRQMDIISMDYESLVSQIAPGTSYHDGLISDGRRIPFAGLCAGVDGNWSDEMAESLEDASKHHFIDVYNRRITLDYLRPALRKDSACYMDVGCSSGYMIEDVMAAFPEALACGCDYFPAGLKQCNRRVPKIPLFQADITRAPVGESIFDAISCLNVLEHIQDDMAALRSMREMLKPGGLLALTVPLGPNLYDMFDEIHYHVRRYTLDEMREKLRSAGFEVRFSNAIGVMIYPAFYLTKKLNRLRYGKLSFAEKQKKAFRQIETTKRSALMDGLCSFEYSLGAKLSYPFGVRGFALAEKPY